jgi:hypothetical protein
MQNPANTMWINTAPRFLRQKFVKSAFPDIVWYESNDLDVHSEVIRREDNGMDISATSAHYQLVIRARNCHIYIKSECLAGIYLLDNLRRVGGAYGRIRVCGEGTAGTVSKEGVSNESTVSTCTYDSYCDRNYNIIWEEVSGSWASDVQCTMAECGNCYLSFCRGCRKVEYTKIGLRGIAEKIDVTIRDTQSSDIIIELEILRRNVVKFTLLCIWALRWGETGLQMVPRDVIRLIMGKIL